jgi:hypothetical protein
MWRFMEEKKAARGIRLSLEPFGPFQNIDAIPLYAVKLVTRS